MTAVAHPDAGLVDLGAMLSFIGVRHGEHSARLPLDWPGLAGKVADGLNEIVAEKEAFCAELEWVSESVGKQGRLAERMERGALARGWAAPIESINGMIDDLVRPTREMQRVIGDVAAGDLDRKVTLDVRGEMLDLERTINGIVGQLALHGNRERFTRMLQGARDPGEVSEMILSELAPLVAAQHGVFYAMTDPADGADRVLEPTAGYGGAVPGHASTTFRVGEGLVGQCAREKKRILVTDVPGDYVHINFGLGASPPRNIIIFPVLFEGEVRAVVELASLSPFTARHQALLEELSESIGLAVHATEVSARTESLLRQSQSHAAELAVSSKYKSEFIANMSHELRTPLNSLLILAEQLADDPEHTMTGTQVEYASVILASGRDLLGLLNTILDLAKVESGTAGIELAAVSIGRLHDELVREFEPVARSLGLAFSITLAPDCPREIVSDPQRLRQILKNLITNAFKFTEHGGVRLEVGLTRNGWSHDAESLATAPSVLSLAVTDTGIGIDELHRRRIFEAFAQGDGATARRFGGTGLGLSISRELVGLLGGEITLQSTVGSGSTFTVLLPLGHIATPTPNGDGEGGRAPTSGSAPLLLVAANNRAAALSAWPRLAADGHHRLDDGPFEGRKILVIDDDFRNVFALTALLERGQAEVIVAESGADALAVLEDTPDISLVLTDVMMPGLDGYDTMRAIRALEGFTNVPIIAVTGKVVAGERRRCLDAGANDCVRKPVDTDELIAAIGPWLPPAAPTSSDAGESHRTARRPSRK